MAGTLDGIEGHHIVSHPRHLYFSHNFPLSDGKMLINWDMIGDAEKINVIRGVAVPQLGMPRCNVPCHEDPGVLTSRSIHNVPCHEDPGVLISRSVDTVQIPP